MRFYWSGTCLGILIGICYVVIFPARYEVFCAVETSMVAGMAVESPAMLSEKAKLPNYFSHTTQQLCEPDSTNHDNGTLNAVLKTTYLKNTNNLNLTVSMADANQATVCMNKIVEEMDAQQSKLRESLLAQKQSQLEAMNAQIKLIDESAADIQALTKHRVKDHQFEASVWLLTTTQTMAEELHQLRKSQQDLQQSLLTQNTHGVRLLTPVWTPQDTTEPAAWLVLLLASLLGWLGEFAFRQFICDSRRCSPASP